MNGAASRRDSAMTCGSQCLCTFPRPSCPTGHSSAHAALIRPVLTGAHSTTPGDAAPSGQVLGMFPTCFMLDGLATLGPWGGIVEAMNRGQGRERFYVVVAQSVKEIDRCYSEPTGNAIRSACAVRAILAQNDRDAIAEIVSTVGICEPGGAEAESPATPLLSTKRIAVMPPQRHLLLAEGFSHRPIDCHSCLYYLEPQMLFRGSNPRASVEEEIYPRGAPIPSVIQGSRLYERFEAGALPA